MERMAQRQMENVIRRGSLVFFRMCELTCCIPVGKTVDEGTITQSLKQPMT